MRGYRLFHCTVAPMVQPLYNRLMGRWTSSRVLRLAQQEMLTPVTRCFRSFQGVRECLLCQLANYFCATMTVHHLSNLYFTFILRMCI